MIKKLLFVLCCMIGFLDVAVLAQGAQISINSNGWSVKADQASGVITISHRLEGQVLQDVRLGLKTTQGSKEFNSFVALQKGDNVLSIITQEPQTSWLFELHQNELHISSNSFETILKGVSPADSERIVARLVDEQGAPVTWVGTDEVKATYGGSETRNRSYLPQKNPDVMSFSLGPVAAENLHSLFDRKTDTAIRFPSNAVMARDAEHQNALKVSIPVEGNALIRLTPDYYTNTLGLPFYVQFDDSYFKTAPMVWCSWTSYYGAVTESDIIKNTDWIAANLKPYGFQYIQLDDGYDRGLKEGHYWIDKWSTERFPHGPQFLTSYIKSKGLRPGIWLVPNAYAGAVAEHPDWYVYRQDGEVVRDYNTPALDATNPEVLKFLRQLFTTLNGWGFEYYKFDGEHALPETVPGLNRQKLYDKTIEPVVAYRNRLKVIRETIGPHTFVEGCPAGAPMNGIGYFNSYFNGHDVTNTWNGMYSLFSSINANAFLNHIVTYTMPGEGIEVGPRMSVEDLKAKRVPDVLSAISEREDPAPGLGTSMAEARTLVTFVSLSGVAYSLASVAPEIPSERAELLKKTLPTLPILPIDLYSRGTDMEWRIFRKVKPENYIHNYPEILDLKVNATSGIYDVVGVTNWHGEKTTREISFAEKLGLDRNRSYVVFDFWNQRLLGVFKDGMGLEIEPHDTRVLSVHPMLNRPQLLGTSRHITGAYSIESLNWDGAKNILSGLSETVAGEPYTLWIYLPTGATLKRVESTTTGGQKVAARYEIKDNLLTINFTGQKQSVNWRAEFGAAALK